MFITSSRSYPDNTLEGDGLKGIAEIRPLFTGLTISVTILVLTLAVTLMFLEPANLLRWVLAFSFLPVTFVITVLYFRKDREENKGKSFIRKMRSTVIGASVLLATALGTVLAESLGFIWIEENQGLNIWALLPALLAVAIDYYTSKLQTKAEQEE